MILPIVLVATGCAATPAVQRASADRQASEPELASTSVSASALVFEPNVPTDYPMVGLDRAPREPSAFFGYQEGITESYVVYTDDDQHFGGYASHGSGWGHGGGGGWSDDYERRAITVKSGIVER